MAGGDSHLLISELSVWFGFLSEALLGVLTYFCFKGSD